MKTKTTFIVMLAGLGFIAQAQPMRVLVTHEQPTKEQLALVKTEEGKLDQSAKELDFEVVRDGDDILVFDADLYNVRAFERCLKGLDAIARMLGAGKKEFTLGELTGPEQAAFRDLLLFKGDGPSLGPALFNDKTSISLGMTWYVALEANGKKANSYVDRGLNEPELEPRVDFNKKEFEEFIKNELPKHAVKQHDFNQLVVHTTVSWVTSARRTEAVGKVMKLFTERLKLQAKAYVDKQALLVNAFGGSDSIRKGLATDALSEEDRIGMVSLLQAMGSFKDDDSARNFITGAKITGVTPSVRIGVYFSVDNKRAGGSTMGTIRRGGG